MIKISNQIFSLIFTYSKYKNIFLIFFLISTTFIEGLSIAIIFPILEIFINKENDNFLHYLIPNLKDENILLLLLVIISTIFFVKSLFLALFAWWRTGYHRELNKYFRVKLLKNYILNNYLFFIKNKPSILLRNSYTEISFLIQSIDSFLKLISEIFVFLIIFFILLYFQPKFTFFIFIIFLLFGIFYFSFIKKKLTLWSNNKIFYTGKIIQNLQQTFDSIKFIKIRNLERRIMDDYNKNVEGFSTYTRLQMFASEIPKIFLEIIGVGAILFLMYLIYDENQADLSYLIPTLGLLAISAFRILPCINRIMNNAQNILNSVASINAVIKNLNLDKEFNKEEKNLKSLFNDKLEIKKLSYKYPDSDYFVLKDINLSIYKNEFVCISGESGTGKTTLADLILGLLKPTIGEILIDNRKLEDKEIINWQKKIGFVPQNIILFNDTFKENITFSKSGFTFDKKAFDNAVKNSQLLDFISSKQQKEEFLIDEKGKNISFGQIQRIGIARALYFNPEILILDEFTSALDFENQEKILNVIKNISGKKTIIIISHSKRVMESADKIIHIGKEKNIKIIKR